jgi:hypothetical protein
MPLLAGMLTNNSRFKRIERTMVKSEAQRQKKLAKKRSKELQNRREVARRNQSMNSIAGKMHWASRYPVHRCLASEAIFEGSGMGTIYFTRSLGDGRLALMFLLIDAHCLGVKDAGCRFCTPTEFEEFLARGQSHENFVRRDPSYAKKLTDQAIAYAESIGFSPHADYRKVAPIWGDVDASQCTEEFTFGLDGKPSYFAGPFDDSARQNFIFRKLCETVGEGNFHFTLGGNALNPDQFGFLSEGRMMSDSDDVDEDEDHEGDWDGTGRVIEGSVSGSISSNSAATLKDNQSA